MTIETACEWLRETRIPEIARATSATVSPRIRTVTPPSTGGVGVGIERVVGELNLAPVDQGQQLLLSIIVHPGVEAHRAGGIGENPDQARFTHLFWIAIESGDAATVDIDSHTKNASQKDIRASMGELPVV